ncbi:hypothetical protein [Streptomyces mirabilis]|uniref:hypothetical protein n=1 Tax=Streptomyces mirabilis TaxID=68239 RepID=UPI00332090E9
MLSPGSVSRLRDLSANQCASGDGSVYPGFGTCDSSDAYVWTLRSFGGGTFELVTRASGSCLSAPFNRSPPWRTAAVMVATCNSDEPQQLWNNGGTA